MEDLMKFIIGALAFLLVVNLITFVVYLFYKFYKKDKYVEYTDYLITDMINRLYLAIFIIVFLFTMSFFIGSWLFYLGDYILKLL